MSNTERTLSIIKPDATERNISGKILDLIEQSGLRIIAQRRLWMTKKQAENFYIIHKERPFFEELVNYMSSGPVVVQVLEGADAVAHYRTIMGATNPDDADAGTIRKLYGVSIAHNTVHGSDSLDNACKEVSFFFSDTDITG